MPVTREGVAFSIELTFRDVFWWVFRKHLWQAWPLTLFLAFGCLLVLSGAIWALRGTAALFGLWFLFTWVIPYIAARSAYRRLHVPSGVRYLFSEAGIDLWALSAAGHVSWDNVTKARETNPLLELEFSGATELIPKSALSPEDLTALKALLRAHVKKNRWLKP